MDPQEDGGQVDEFLKDAQIQGVKSSHTLSNQEVAILLERYKMSKIAGNPGFCPPPMVAKTQGYLDAVLQGVGRNADAAQIMRERASEAGCADPEMVLLINLLPENADEAYALIPSLKRNERLTREDLEALLEELHTHRTYQ